MSFEVNRRLLAKRSPLETDAVVDSVTAGIIRGAFETFCFETAIHLGRSASSAIPARPAAAMKLSFFPTAET